MRAVNNARIIGQGVIRGGPAATGLIVALLALLLLAPGARAAPELGRWEGVAADGVQVSFEVRQVQRGARRAVTYLTIACPLEAELNIAQAAKQKSSVIVSPGDTGRPFVYPIGRGGRIEQSGGPDGIVVTPAIRGKLGRSSANVRISNGLACDGRKFGASVKLHVEAVARAVAPTSGVWVIDSPPTSELRFELFGTTVQYFNGRLLTGAGTYEGVPYPCVSLLVDSLGTWLPADGSFVVEKADPARPISIRGQFDSATAISGTYAVAPAPADVALFRCSTIPFPFQAHLEKAAPEPLLDGRPLVGPQPTPPSEATLPIPTEPADYVALGDSYSSGEGVPPFDPATDTKTNKCHRSTRAYSQVFAPPNYQLNRTFLACSGAVTDNVGRLDAAGSLTGVPHPDDDSGVLQLARLDAATWGQTDLVTISIGGNDAQFASVLKQCVFLPCHRGKRAKRIIERIANEVPGLLAGAYAAIRRTAPNATVVAMGYPQLFPNDPRERCPLGKRRVVSRVKQIFLRERGEQLNRIVASQAAAAGIHFVDLERAFSGHEPCGKGEEWLHGLVVRGPTVFSFHPNAKGQRAYASELRGYFACLYGRDFPFEASGVPEPVSAAQPAPAECR